jgi:Protein of unknown function (DUF3606)
VSGRSAQVESRCAVTTGRFFRAVTCLAHWFNAAPHLSRYVLILSCRYQCNFVFDRSLLTEMARQISHISINDNQEVRYWTEALGCSKDELAAAVARVGNSTDAVRREVYRHWAYGTFRPGDTAKKETSRRRRGRPRNRA